MRENQREWMRKAGLASSIGLVLAVSIAIGYFVGSWLDKVFHTAPWLMLILTLMGIAAGFIEVVRIASALSGDE